MDFDEGDMIINEYRLKAHLYEIIVDSFTSEDGDNIIDAVSRCISIYEAVKNVRSDLI